MEQNQNSSTPDLDPTDMLPWQLRLFLSTYFVAAMIFCFFSNVLIADYLKKSRHVFLHMDPISLHCIHHLAVSDIIFQIIRLFPMATTSIAGRWIFGDKMCFLNSILKFAPCTATLYFLIIITLLQVCKVARSEEFITSRSTARRSRILVLILWGIAALSSLLLALKDLDYLYQPWNMECEVDETASFKIVVLITMFGVPLLLLLLLLTTLIILCCACCPNRFDSRATLIVELSILFILTTAPSVSIKLWGQYGGSVPGWTRVLDSTLYTVFVVVRPVLYTTVCNNFKEHLINTLCCGRRRVAQGSVDCAYSTIREDR